MHIPSTGLIIQHQVVNLIPNDDPDLIRKYSYPYIIPRSASLQSINDWP
jgi:hypothetical protein